MLIYTHVKSNILRRKSNHCNNEKVIISPFEMRLKQRMELEYRSNIEEIYYTDLGASFHGDGYRYSIFSCEKPEVIWENEKPEFNYKELLNDVYRELSVPEEKRVKLFEGSYYQIADDGSKLLLIYDNECMKLYSIEEIL